MRNVLAVLALVSGCYKDNPNYDGSDANPDSDDMTGPACETSEDCTSETPVCDDNVCVQCTAINQEACSPSLVCGETNECRGCESHDECLLSHACLASGQCADAEDVAYVAPGATGVDCVASAPCGTLLEAVARLRPVIKLAAGRTPVATTVLLTDRAIEVVADPGAELGSDSESVLRLDGPAAAATVSDVTVIGTQVPIAPAAAFTVTDLGGRLTLHRVTVHHHRGAAVRAFAGDVTIDRCNLVENTGGGVFVSDARFAVTSSLVVNNGGTTAPFGGVQITRPQPGSKFAFNTVSSNASTNIAATGMDCTPSFAFTSSIIRGNSVAEACEATYTLFVPPVASPAGAGNIPGMPGFIETNPMRYDQPTFYRIDATSAAIDVATPDDDVTLDIDGDARTAAPDMGADER